MEDRILGNALALIIAIVVLVLIFYHFNLWRYTPWGNCYMVPVSTPSVQQQNATPAVSDENNVTAAVIDTSLMDSSDIMVS